MINYLTTDNEREREREEGEVKREIVIRRLSNDFGLYSCMFKIIEILSYIFVYENLKNI